MGSLSQDVRYSIRMLLKQPLFTAAAVITLALGIGATAAVFSVLDAVVLRPLPFTAPDEVVNLHPARNGAPIATASPSRRMNDSAGMRAMSIKSFGRASRIAMKGTSVWPPAMILASSLAASSAQTSSRLAGRTYSNSAGFIVAARSGTDGAIFRG